MIQIKDMEIPKRCAECKFCANQKTNDYGTFGKCLLQNKNVDCLLWSRDISCPLTESAEWVDDKCSACGKGIDDLIESSEWYRNESPKYCPFCGIKIHPYKAESGDKE